MAIQTINLGLIANDGTGDDLREAFTKVNANFADLDVRAANITAENAAVGAGFGVFKEQDGTVLKFRDFAWNKYFTNESYLNLVEKKFGLEQRQNVIDMSQVKLKRKLLGD